MWIKRIVMITLVIGISLWVLLSSSTKISYKDIDVNAVSDGGYNDALYHILKDEYASVTPGVSVVTTAGDITINAFDGEAYQYDGDIARLEETESFQFSVDVPETGAYEMVLTQLDVSDNILPNEIRVMINGESLYEEMDVIELSTHWAFETDGFTFDRYGNEILPNSIKETDWITEPLYDKTALNAAPLLFELEAGSNNITIEAIGGEFLLAQVEFRSESSAPSYDTYRSLNDGSLVDQTIIIGAEELASKNNPSIRLDSERDPSATSYDTKYLRLNTIAGDSYRSGNDTIYYEIDVPETGYYHLAFKYRQDFLMQMPVFREITIDGDVPFQELAMYPFMYTEDYKNLILNNGEEDFEIYLTKGTHTLGLRTVLEPYRNSYQNIVGIMDEITDLSLEIKKLTGNTADRYRTWELVDYIPDIESRFDRWIEDLEEIEMVLQGYSHQNNPGEMTNIRLAIEQLQELRSDVDDIPLKMVMLADGSSSTSQLLGVVVQHFLENGLAIEKLALTGTGDLPRPEANVFVRSFESIQRFVLSFTQNDYAIGDVDEGTIEVWVNHPRQYIEIMQTMIDNEFTKDTGIEVQLSLMPDENKLILSNAAGTAPDVALGVNNWIPYEFAIRGASLDLRTMDGYEETVSQFSKGAMIPYAFEEGIYGIPETQNFWVTYYRTDIFDSVGLPVPDTWEEVTEILPELQRYGMNYYEPLAMFKGFKPFVATMPFIYQFDGTLYAEDGMSTLINSEETLEGIELMTDLFTVYNLPKEVPNFYNHFRYGTMPIGISDLSTYLQLTIAAPEIAGKWEIAVHPGVEKQDGTVERWAAVGAQSSMVLADTEYPDASWAFLSWWMSTSVQTNYALRLQTTYGTEYLWNTANLEAFANLPLPSRHKDVILEQWEYAIEASRIPGAYMVERELSNAWNTIVFDDSNPRITLDEAVKTSNREILYKMEEFGYALNGDILRNYRVPTIENIDYWLKERDDDE